MRRYLGFIPLLLISLHTYSYTLEHDSYIVNRSKKEIIITYMDCNYARRKDKKQMENCYRRAKNFAPGEFLSFNMDLYDDHKGTLVEHFIQIIKAESGDIISNFVYIDENLKRIKPENYYLSCRFTMPARATSFDINSQNHIICQESGGLS